MEILFKTQTCPEIRHLQLFLYNFTFYVLTVWPKAFHFHVWGKEIHLWSHYQKFVGVCLQILYIDGTRKMWYSKPTRWHAFPITDKGSLQGLLKGKISFKCVYMVHIWWEKPQIIESYQLSDQVDFFLSQALLWCFNNTGKKKKLF